METNPAPLAEAPDAADSFLGEGNIVHIMGAVESGRIKTNEESYLVTKSSLLASIARLEADVRKQINGKILAEIEYARRKEAEYKSRDGEGARLIANGWRQTAQVLESLLGRLATLTQPKETE